MAKLTWIKKLSKVLKLILNHYKGQNKKKEHGKQKIMNNKYIEIAGFIKN